MNKIYYYNVGGLCFSANADMTHPALFNFCPFAVKEEEVKETIFSLGYIEQLPPISEEMNAVCHVCDNGTCWNFYYSTCYTYDIILCIEGEQCRIYRMQADSDWHCVRIDWKVQDEIDAQALNNILMLSYVAAAAPRSRVLLHSACVRTAAGEGVAFIGHSGVGKSTHARLWLRYVPGCTLMNDDQPIVSLEEDGIPYIYGSPWSGKTVCYRQMKAPLKLVCLMKQASQNRLISLTNLQGFTILLAAVSMIKEQTEVYRGIVRTLARVVESVPVVYLENRPEQEAVQLVWEKYDTGHRPC